MNDINVRKKKIVVLFGFLRSQPMTEIMKLMIRAPLLMISIFPVLCFST